MINKNILLILSSIIIISVIGLGYLELNKIKFKINSIENYIKEKEEKKLEFKNKLIKKQQKENEIKNEEKEIKQENKNPVCIICKQNTSDFSSMNKYHLKYCNDCAEKDYEQLKEKIKNQKKMENTEIMKEDEILNNIINTINNITSDEEKSDEEDILKQEYESEESEEKLELELKDENEEQLEDENEEQLEDENEEQLEDDNEEQLEDQNEEQLELNKQIELDDDSKSDEFVLSFESESKIEDITTQEYDKENYNKLQNFKLDILRKLLKENNLSYSGNKSTVINRIIMKKINIDKLIN